MRGVLDRMTVGAAQRILDSVNSREMRVAESFSVATKTREGTAGVTKKHKLLSGYQEDLCAEEFR